VATTDSTAFSLPIPRPRIFSRELAELLLGFTGIMTILWLPTAEQLIFGPIALLIPLVLVLLRKPTLDQLGLGLRGLVPSLWVLPAAVSLTIVSIFLAQQAGTFHSLSNAGFSHAWGYIVWTMYQQFLMQDFFMPRLQRAMSSDTAIVIAATLFAVAHLPNVTLAIATLVWGAVSCLLFRRYRNLYVLGLAQGILGLCFAVCVPDVLIHHMRVGLGYWHYHVGQ